MFSRQAIPTLHICFISPFVVSPYESCPRFFHKGFPIHGIPSVESLEDAFVFHSGTAKGGENEIITSGGRVLSVAILGENLREAHDRAYSLVGQIKFESGFYRRDIGRRALEVLR